MLEAEEVNWDGGKGGMGVGSLEGVVCLGVRVREQNTFPQMFLHTLRDALYAVGIGSLGLVLISNNETEISLG